MLESPLKVPGDLVVHVESLEYCTKTALVGNPTGSAITLSRVVGYPLIAGTGDADFDIAMAGDEADVIALLMDSDAGRGYEEIAAGEVGLVQYQALHKAPCIVNRDHIETTDYADADFDVDAIVTALEALNFEFRTGPIQSTVL